MDQTSTVDEQASQQDARRSDDQANMIAGLTGSRIVREGQHDLWRAIPPCGDVPFDTKPEISVLPPRALSAKNALSHESRSSLRGQIRVRLESTRKAKVANLELAVGVDLHGTSIE